MLHKTYQYKLRPTKVQEEQIERMIGHCRFVYNIAKETRENAYRSNKVSIGKFDLQKQLKELRNSNEGEFLKEVPVETLRHAIVRLDESFKKFFRKEANYPNWAKKGKYRSITFGQGTPSMINHNRIKLPKLKSVKFFENRKPEGKIKQATIVKEMDGYYISILTEQEQIFNPYLNGENQSIGLDMGISYYLVTSDGEYVENPRFFESTMKKLRREQRSLSRKKKGSNNWYEQKRKVAKMHLQVTRQRKDFLHKLSSKIVRENSFIALEDLNVKGMVKSRLARSIGDVSWSMFRSMLQYKSQWYGREFVLVDPKYTSQTCYMCGHVSKNNRETQSKFKCEKCGFETNADENAAKNILGRACPMYHNVDHQVERGAATFKI